MRITQKKKAQKNTKLWCVIVFRTQKKTASSFYYLIKKLCDLPFGLRKLLISFVPPSFVFFCVKKNIYQIFVTFTIKKILQHIIYSNLVVSLSLGMLCWGISHQLRISNASPDLEKWYGIFVFSATLVTYNFQRLIKFNQLKSTQSEQMIWIYKHQKYLYFLILISSLLCGISFFRIYSIHSKILFILIFSIIISLLYIIKIGGTSLRERPYLKIHLIAIVCTTVVGMIKLLNENTINDSNFSITNSSFVLAHYFYFVAITIPFDIRDLKYDSPSLKTIPQVFGIKKSRIISICLFVFYLIILLLFKTTIYKNPAFILSSLLTIFLLAKTNEKRPDFYFSGIIEGSIFIMGLSYLLQ